MNWRCQSIEGVNALEKFATVYPKDAAFQEAPCRFTLMLQKMENKFIARRDSGM
jgi:hypothetical protein